MKKFDIPATYSSSIIQEIKEKRKKEDRMKRDFSPSIIERNQVQFILPRHFGFCYGVENAVEIIYKTIQNNPTKNIYLLSQMIHNPLVNEDLKSQGVKFIQDTYGNQLINWNDIKQDDIVVIPAFGTTIEIEKILKDKGVQFESFNTTCPFVEKVWKRSKKLSEQNHTIIIHGKAKHEETRATFSHSTKNGKAIILKDLKEAEVLAELILNNAPTDALKNKFGEKMSEDLTMQDFNKVGVVNQTTMLASETHEIANFFKQVMIKKYGEEKLPNHFADTRDTLCYATNDNQNATLALMNEKADLAIVVGGYNSSNTTHLAELLEQKFNTFFIAGPNSIKNLHEVNHYDFHKQKEITSSLINNKDIRSFKRIIVTCGASCPDKVMQDVIEKIDLLFSTHS